METKSITKGQARRFLLEKQGLLGGYKFRGKQGALDFIRQAGCVQFDPVDVCGKNAELVLHSRVKGVQKQMISDLLYSDRSLIDYFDKNLAIFPVEDRPYFERFRRKHRIYERSHSEVGVVKDEISRIISERGPVCSSDLDMTEKVHWYWSDTRLSRAALEHMYFIGELAVHHKKGSVKYYDLIENCVSPPILASPDPCPEEREHRKWRALRRIGGIGLLWNRASDAWLNIEGFHTPERNAVFSELLEHSLFHRNLKKRCEFIAPLDNLLWDGKLIKAIFDFNYKWEIYTPADKRQFGHYVLPILYGDRFVGRIEAAADRKKGRLDVKNIWYEPKVKRTDGLESGVADGITRLATFHNLDFVNQE